MTISFSPINQYTAQSSVFIQLWWILLDLQPWREEIAVNGGSSSYKPIMALIYCFGTVHWISQKTRIMKGGLIEWCSMVCIYVGSTTNDVSLFWSVKQSSKKQGTTNWKSPYCIVRGFCKGQPKIDSCCLLTISALESAHYCECVKFPRRTVYLCHKCTGFGQKLKLPLKETSIVLARSVCSR